MTHNSSGNLKLKHFLLWTKGSHQSLNVDTLVIFFSVITKNSNWEILPKNLVTFKRKDDIKDEKL